MAKEVKPKLNEVEKFYIKSNPDGLTDVDLSKKIKKPIELIQKVLEEAKKEAEEAEALEKQKEEAKKNPKNATLFKQNMARPGKKGKNVATAMTASASELADLGRKKSKLENLKHVYRPYSE